MERNTKAIVLAVVIGSIIISLTVALIGRYQITGGPEGLSLGGGSTYIVRDNWTGRSWWEQVGRR
jgi:hypothetical protein